MGLDIRFLGHDTATADLDGTRLTTVPGFLNLVRVLGQVLKHLNDADDSMNLGVYRRAASYAQQHPEAEDRFRQYLAFAAKMAQLPDVQVGFSVDPADYDPLAGTFAAALMLRDDPMGGEEAREVLALTSFLGGFARSLAMFSNVGADRESVEWMVEVLEKYNQCLELAADRSLSFRIDF